MVVDLNIHLGDLMVTGTLAVLGFGLKKFYTLVAGKIDEHEQIIVDVDAHAEIINLHTQAFNKDGHHQFPIVERRHRHRRGVDAEADF